MKVSKYEKDREIAGILRYCMNNGIDINVSQLLPLLEATPLEKLRELRRNIEEDMLDLGLGYSDGKTLIVYTGEGNKIIGCRIAPYPLPTHLLDSLPMRKRERLGTNGKFVSEMEIKEELDGFYDEEEEFHIKD